MRRIVLTAFVGVCAFLGGMAANLAPRLVPSASALSVPGVHTSRGGDEASRIESRFEAVARQVAPTVVAVEATKPAAPARDGRGKRSLEEAGSGVLLRFEGRRDVFVVTNNHVIQDAPPRQITVSLADGRVVRPDRVWADPESDVAILQLAGVRHLTPATPGDSDKARVGQWVLAVGSPFGLNQTVTHGIVSARERGQVSLGGTIRIKDFIQTDAAINPGSSGGPLFNLDGELIGINTAIASTSSSNSGVAFSIPINRVKKVAKQLLEKGSVSRGYLGLQLAGTLEPAEALRLGLERTRGALVETVYPQTPAAAAGLRPNDVVLQVDGLTVRHENHFINLISALPPGRKIRLEVWRERRTVSLDAVIGDWAKGQERLGVSP